MTTLNINYRCSEAPTFTAIAPMYTVFALVYNIVICSPQIGKSNKVRIVLAM